MPRAFLSVQYRLLFNFGTPRGDPKMAQMAGTAGKFLDRFDTTAEEKTLFVAALGGTCTTGEGGLKRSLVRHQYGAASISSPENVQQPFLSQF